MRFEVKLISECTEKQMLEAGIYPDKINDYDVFWVLIDTKTGEVIGYDGGEPEDQLLVRDWSWVPDILNKIASGEYPL